AAEEVHGLEPLRLARLRHPAVAARRVAEKSLEASREGLRVLEADCESYIEHGMVGDREQHCRSLEPDALDVLLRRLTDDIREEAMEMERRGAEPRREVAQPHVFGEPFVQIDEERKQTLRGARPLPGAAVKALRCRGV